LRSTLNATGSNHLTGLKWRKCWQHWLTCKARKRGKDISREVSLMQDSCQKCQLYLSWCLAVM